MEARFHQLSPGQRFQWQGSTYEKINPLLARDVETGAQRLIPRSTSVEVAAGAVTTPATAPHPTVDLVALRRAFEDYHHGSLHWLERMDGPEAIRAQAHAALEQARQRFLVQLGDEAKETTTAFPGGNAG